MDDVRGASDGENAVAIKLYLISQSVNDGYDTYDSAVVAAESEEDAKVTHPSGDVPLRGWNEEGKTDTLCGSWTSKKNVQCRYIGDAAPGIKCGVVCASFNAG